VSESLDTLLVKELEPLYSEGKRLEEGYGRIVQEKDLTQVQNTPGSSNYTFARDYDVLLFQQ